MEPPDILPTSPWSEEGVPLPRNGRNRVIPNGRPQNWTWMMEKLHLDPGEVDVTHCFILGLSGFTSSAILCRMSVSATAIFISRNPLFRDFRSEMLRPWPWEPVTPPRRVGLSSPGFSRTSPARSRRRPHDEPRP